MTASLLLSPLFVTARTCFLLAGLAGLRGMWQEHVWIAS